MFVYFDIKFRISAYYRNMQNVQVDIYIAIENSNSNF